MEQSPAAIIEYSPVVDLEVQVNRVWNTDVRPTVQEAWRCYGAGAYRACIVLTWAAVCTDLIDKMFRLADEGDGDAKAIAEGIAQARALGMSSDGVRRMQQVESKILANGVAVELLDAVSERNLERLRQDRHLCVHPSLQGFGEPYEPDVEYARAHMAASLEGLLTQPPTQGRKVIDAFVQSISDPAFVFTPGYITHTFYDRVRPAARRNIVSLAAKHAILQLELPISSPVNAATVADRMASCLAAFAAHDRDTVRNAVRSVVLGRLDSATASTLGNSVKRVGNLDVFWEALSDRQVERLEAMVRAMTLPPREQQRWGDPTTTAPENIALLSAAASGAARGRLPILERLNETSPTVQAAVMQLRPSQAFTHYLTTFLFSWRALDRSTLRLNGWSWCSRTPSTSTRSLWIRYCASGPRTAKRVSRESCLGTPWNSCVQRGICRPVPSGFDF